MKRGKGEKGKRGKGEKGKRGKGEKGNNPFGNYLFGGVVGASSPQK